LFLHPRGSLLLFVSVQEGAYIPNNENAISYQLCFYQPNVPEKMRHKTNLSASAAKKKTVVAVKSIYL